jgi:2-polyprenyl-6-methoxyphenol hydroxylase-like FAD-dependent oxidoreductase
VERGDAVEADFENGKSVLVDALVGADGIHSTVQRILFGPRSAHTSPAVRPTVASCHPSV